MQVCQFFSPETLNSISSWSFPIRDFPTLLRNHILSNNQALLLLIDIFFLQFFLPLCLSIMFFTFTSYVTPKHSSLICIRYFITLFGFPIQLRKYFIIIIISIIIIIIIIIVIIYHSILCPTKQKEKGKKFHYPRRGNSLLNHEKYV